MEPLTIPRRDLLRLTAAGGTTWLTGVAGALARAEGDSPREERARSVILLWLAGGPSQLETFDPHPGTRIAGGTKAIDTAIRGVQLAKGLEQVAGRMESISLVRSLVSKEGDHERGTYLVKTGYRPNPTVQHPSIGAICCHRFDGLELDRGRIPNIGIPRHVSILTGPWPSRGGFLGAEYDAFKTGDPARKVPDVTPRVTGDRQRRRLEDLDVVERAFARGTSGAAERTRHRQTLAAARKMMAAEQLAAFDVLQEPSSVRDEYGDTPFGRGCLAARRLVAVGVRCVEVTLSGWDTHLNNHAGHQELLKPLDPALAALVRDLRRHGLLERTVVMCGGEFGRTPRINPANGRDHWPHGFTMALAGGGLRGGQVIGATDPQGSKNVEQPRRVADVHATVLTALGINPAEQLYTRQGRPVKLSDGKPIGSLLG